MFSLSLIFTKQQYLFFRFALFFAISIAAVFLFLRNSDMQTTHFLPSPEKTCSIPVKWKGIQPGISTKQNVISALGQPTENGVQKIGDIEQSYFLYKIKSGKVANFAGDRIVFRDNVVDWMEIAVGDRDGYFHHVSDVSAQYGNTIDNFYVNSSYHPLDETGIGANFTFGPDYVYVWTDCGIALDVMRAKKHSDKEFTVRNIDELSKFLIIPSADGSPRLDEALPNESDIILFQFIFTPTSQQGFREYYKYNRFPYTGFSGAWAKYIKTIDASKQSIK